MRRRPALPALIALPVAVALLAALAACASGGDAGGNTPTPTTAAATPTPTATVTPPPTDAVVVPPKPSPTQTSAADRLPTDCGTLASAATREAAVGDMRLQSDGVGFTRPAPSGASLALGCDWIVGDTTGMLLLISTADPAAISVGVVSLTQQGYTCQVADDFGATYCVKPGANADTESTVVARDDVWIYLETSNRSGRAILSEIVGGIFQ